MTYIKRKLLYGPKLVEAINSLEGDQFRAELVQDMDFETWVVKIENTEDAEHPAYEDSMFDDDVPNLKKIWFEL